MKVKLSTVNKVVRVPNAFTATYSTPVVMYLDVSNAEFRPYGASLLQVFDKDTYTSYNTNLAFATAITTLDAAPVNGQWVL